MTEYQMPWTDPNFPVLPMKHVLTLIISTAAIVSILLTINPSTAISGETAADYYNEGVKLFQEGCQGDPGFKKELCDKAIAFLEKAIKIDPKLASAYMALANAYWNKSFFDSKNQKEKTGLQEKATNLYRKVIEIDPNNSEAYYKLSIHSKDVNEEISLLRKIIDLDPKHPEAHGYLARILLSQGENDDAIREYMIHLQVSPYCGTQDANNHILFAKSLAEVGRLKESVQVLEKLLDIINQELRRDQCLVIESIDLKPYSRFKEFTEKVEKLKLQCSEVR
jgi:tetratricopeptide (TPR) repeat protein